MSFLAGRLAGKEGAYFFQESRKAVGRLASQKKPPSPSPPPPPFSPASEHESQADVLPEVLRHSLPSNLFHEASNSPPSAAYAASKWGLRSDPSSNGASVNAQALNPLRAYLSMPQVTFGPKRWQLPEANNSVSASTANDLRRDQHPPVNPEKLKAAAEGLAQIGKAFAVATALVFGGATLMFGMAKSKLELQNSDDIRTKVRDLVEPKLGVFKKQLLPLKDWAENMSKKWHLEREQDLREKPMIKELSKILGAKSSN